MPTKSIHPPIHSTDVYRNGDRVHESINASIKAHMTGTHYGDARPGRGHHHCYLLLQNYHAMMHIRYYYSLTTKTASKNRTGKQETASLILHPSIHPSICRLASPLASASTQGKAIRGVDALVRGAAQQLAAREQKEHAAFPISPMGDLSFRSHTSSTT